MGYGAWSNTSYDMYSSLSSSKSRGELYSRNSKYSATKSGQKVNVEEIKFRESRDSDEHPLSTPIIVGLDVSGSMGIIPERLTKEGLGVFVNETLQKKPVTDPHLLFLGIGDSYYDNAPLQATQFESDNKICDQLTDIWLESGGGGNNFENCDLAWAFGIYKTQTDAWTKRKEKGFIFTVGDEEFPYSVSKDYFSKVFGTDSIAEPNPTSILAEAQKQWNIFHVIIAQGHYASRALGKVRESWKAKLDRRALVLDNYDYLPELLVSAMALENGEDLEDVLGWWPQNCSVILEKAFQ